ncbi:MAG: pilus assembly PilX family protein [Janthinobacterium lividum]
MSLLISLIMLLLLTMIGISSMQNATLQEKMSTSVVSRNQSFQIAENVLRVGEAKVAPTTYVLTKCSPAAACTPPTDSATISAAGTGANGVVWYALGTGFYAIQNIGTTAAPVNAPDGCYATYNGTTTYSTVTLYRITGVGIFGTNRSIVESIYAKC